MAEIATPHQTRPNRVLITEPVTMANRGQIARWLEDRGIQVGVPVDVEGLSDVLIVTTTRHGHRSVWLSDRIVISGRDVDVIDHAHYKLWYEPIEEPTP